jgi:hypothetical protein
LHDFGKLLLATEMMWLDETMVRLFGVHSPSLERLPLRTRALLDVATQAGLGNGRTKSQVLVLLRGQSSSILKQWRTMNLMDIVVGNNGAQQSIQNSNIVSLLADQIKVNRELQSVSHISTLLSLFHN